MKNNNKQINLSANIAGLKLKNPVIAASGTFGFGREYSQFVDLNKIGGISVKGLTLEPRLGNPPPRITETKGGILNCVGLENPGVVAFIKDELPFLKKFDTIVFANVAGNSIEEYCKIVQMLNDSDVDAIELNVSCPNVKSGCVAFGNSVSGITQITKAVRKYCKKPLIVKLTPNVTDIKEIAKACEDSGADAVSLINTILGMAIDIQRKVPILSNNWGGLSGPAIKPIAVRMVYEVYKTIKIPIIGMGGIMDESDAIEFFLAGASAVMVGTANFINPNACIEISDGILRYLRQYNFSSINDIIGTLNIY